jgi:hypothetical protein
VVTGALPRSGIASLLLIRLFITRMTFWKQYIVLYGGFHDTGVKSACFSILSIDPLTAYFLSASELPF